MLACAAPALAEEHVIHMYSAHPGDGAQVNVFEPPLLRVNPGDTVRFAASAPSHNTASKKGMIPEGAEEWNGGIDEELVLTLIEEGVYGYICLPHYEVGMGGDRGRRPLGQSGGGAKGAPSRRREAGVPRSSGANRGRMMDDNWQLADEIRDYWSDRAATFDESSGHRIRDDRQAEAWQALFARGVGRADLRGLAVLDLACGTGEISRMALDMGARVTGVDFSEPMLARARAKHAGRDWRGVQADAQRLMVLPDAGFDAAFARHLVWTLTDPQAAFAEWFRVLRPGGRVVVVDGNWGSPPALRTRLLRWLVNCIAPPAPAPDRDAPRFDAIMRRLPYAQGVRPQLLETGLRGAGFSPVRPLSVSRAYGAGLRHLPLAERLRLRAPHRFAMMAIRP